MFSKAKSRTAEKNPRPILLSAIILALFAITFISGCNKDPLKEKPVACFAAIADSVFTGSTLTVNASCSEGAVSYLWSFGDGGTAATASATHTYTNPGSYIVTLTVTNSNGTATKTETVVVKTLVCDPGYEGTNCTTEIRARCLGSYLVSGNMNCSSSGTSYLNNITVLVTNSAQGVTKITLNIGGTTYLVADLVSNSSTFDISSQQSGGFTYTGSVSFPTNTLDLTLTETNNTTSEVCTIMVFGPKQ